MEACLDDDLVGALVARTLPPGEALAARRHLDTCASCRLLVGSLARSVTLPPGDEPTVVDDVAPRADVASRADVDTSALVGKVIAGKYRILRIIGRGGMGCVVAADHLQLKTQVALKLLHPQHVVVEEARVRLGREASAAARIASPYAARVFDVGATEQGVPFMVMELLEGHDLSAELKARGRIGWSEAVRWTLQACHALAVAHRQGIVHRDLKPQNIFVTNGTARSVKVVDFGVSKLLGGDTAEPSYTGQAWIGTPRYMAPEQLTLARAVDQRTDVWAMGIILHELVSGRHPFERESLKAHCAAVLAEDPASLDPASAPPGLDAVIRRCLAKDPGGRYASAHAVAVALAPWAEPGAASILEDMGIVAASRPAAAAASPAKHYALGALVLLAAAGTALATGVMTRKAPGGDSVAALVPGAAGLAETTEPAEPVATVSIPGVAAVAADGADAGGLAPPRALLHVAPPRHARHAEFGGRR